MCTHNNIHFQKHYITVLPLKLDYHHEVGLPLQDTPRHNICGHSKTSFASCKLGPCNVEHAHEAGSCSTANPFTRHIMYVATAYASRKPYGGKWYWQ